MEVPRHWRLRKQRYALVGEICPHCNTKIFPPRDVCPECGGETKKQLFSTPDQIQFPSRATVLQPGGSNLKHPCIRPDPRKSEFKYNCVRECHRVINGLLTIRNPRTASKKFKML